MSLRRLLSLACPTLLVLAAAACGDDAGSGGAGGGTTSVTTGDGTTTGTGMSTTSTTGQGGAGGSGDCSNLPAGPIVPTLETELFAGSEDIAFDGAGNIVGKNGGEVIGVDANDMVTTIAALQGQTYGLRYGTGGVIYAARPNQGTLVEIDAMGNVVDFVTGLAGPNGVYPDFDGNVWLTEFGGNRVVRIDTMGMPTTIAQGGDAISPNGIVKDDVRNVVFYTNYIEGKLLRVDTAGATAPVEVGQVPGANLDGILLDVCGNVYAVDQGNDRLFRFDLDAAGDLVGMPVLLVDFFPTNVANAQFGSGTGWDTRTIYAAGNPGDVYAVPVGVEGAPVPTIND